MIVVGIVAILLAIAIPNFVSAQASSRAETCISDLKSIETAKEQYAMDNGLVSGSAVPDAAALVPTYMPAWPMGPITGTYTANAVGADPTFNNQSAAWYTQHCTGKTADALCPF